MLLAQQSAILVIFIKTFKNILKNCIVRCMSKQRYEPVCAISVSRTVELTYRTDSSLTLATGCENSSNLRKQIDDRIE